MCCRATNMVRVSAIEQVTVLVRAPATEAQVVEKTQHIIQKRIAIGASTLRDVNANRQFTFLAANPSKSATTLPKKTIIAKCNALSEVLWPIPVHGDTLNMTQLYNGAATKAQKLETHYTMAKQDDSKMQKHRTERV